MGGDNGAILSTAYCKYTYSIQEKATEATCFSKTGKEVWEQGRGGGIAQQLTCFKILSLPKDWYLI